jgi:GT2 family glycosyltransferase
VHPLPTVPLTLAFNLGLHHLSRGVGERLCLEGFWDPERAREVPWAIGACLLLRRTAFEQAGRFDERQWMYAEDLDLGWRLHQQGWITRYEPSARVFHESGAATGAAFAGAEAERFLAATYAMLCRRRGAARMWATAAVNVLGAAGRVAWMTPLARIWTRWREPSAESRRWLKAHLHGIRFRSTLAGPS